MKDIIHMIKPNFSMASVDLKDAFYSLPIRLDYEKYSKLFYWKEIIPYRAMPNRYGLCYIYIYIYITCIYGSSFHHATSQFLWP